MLLEHRRDLLLLQCDQALADEPAQFEGPLAEISRALLDLLAPKDSLHPQDSQNALLKLERSFAEGFAELEHAGHRTEGISVYNYTYRLAHLEKKRSK